MSTKNKPIRSKPWPSYATGASTLQPKHLAIARKALAAKRYFRYDGRPYQQTYAGKFEQHLHRYFKTKYALAVSSGTAAIALGLMAAEIPPGSLVACPTFTFAATPSAITLAKCKPLLIEIDKNLNLDLNDLQKKYTPKLKAIVVVHMRGMGENMPAIMKFAKQKKLLVIEDSAAACGVNFKGKKLGTFGDCGAFSTQAGKMINTGEGGFIVTNNKNLYQQLLVFSGMFDSKLYKNQQLAFQHPLYSFRIDEIRAALGLPQIKDINTILKQQQHNYDYLVKNLSKLPIIIRQPLSTDSYSGASLVFRIPGITAIKASKFARALQKEGIDAKAFADPHKLNQRVFWNWRFLFNNLAIHKITKMLPNSYKYLTESFDIPLFANLTKQDLHDLIKALEKVTYQKGIMKNR